MEGKGRIDLEGETNGISEGVVGFGLDTSS
jgi:hypothetical protein